MANEIQLNIKSFICSITVIIDNFMYVVTVSNQKIYVCKRQYEPQGQVMA